MRKKLLLFVCFLLAVSAIVAQTVDDRRCKSVPPPPQNITGPNDVCLGKSILLEGTPTDNRYFLQWEPLDTNIFPNLAEGNEVTFFYGYKNIAGVAVRQVDKATGCRSEAYIHPVVPFTLSKGDIPAVITVHEGDRIHLEVPDQPGQVVYEWIIGDGTATIVGDNFAPSVDVLVNYLDFGKDTRYPHRTRVMLKRKCCGNSQILQGVTLSIEKALADTLSDTLRNLPQNAPPAPVIESISVPEQVCKDIPVEYRAVVQGEHLRYRWDFGDGTFNYGNPVYHTYMGHTYNNSITLTVTDDSGRTAIKKIYSATSTNHLEDGFLLPIHSKMACPGTECPIAYSNHFAMTDYHWFPADTVNKNPVFMTRKSGDYMVYVTDKVTRCRTGEIVQVEFLNAPVAEIVGDMQCKVGSKVRLYGNTGYLNTYTWHISGPETFAFTTPNVEFKARKEGIYKVTLSVTSPDGCTVETQCEVTVSRK